MATGSLVLRPIPPDHPPPVTADLLTALRRIDFIGAGYGDPLEQRFLAGERFLQLITFLGCSPFVQLEPRQDGDLDFCHVRLLGPWPRARFLGGDSAAAPRCANCRSRIEDWRRIVDQWSEDAETLWQCPSCAARSMPDAWAWRQQAGFGRVMLEVPGIFPGEAVPVDGLLRTLQQVNGTDWGHFYIHDAR